MTIDTITMDPAAAAEARRMYQAAVRADRHETRSRWHAEDLALARAYRELARGRAIVDVAAAMRTAGLREDGYPTLAICRAHVARCYCHMGWDGDATFSSAPSTRRGFQAPIEERVRFGAGTFQQKPGYRNQTVSTLVPIIPPTLRPKDALARYHLLWEVASWTLEAPDDPMLLKQLGDDLYAVVAVWDLTGVERAVLGALARKVTAVTNGGAK